VDCWERVAEWRNWELGLNSVFGGRRNDQVLIALVRLRLSADADVNFLEDCP